MTKTLIGNIKGPKGDTGSRGPQGVKGDTGTIGPRGPQGIQGPAGPTPTIGSNGNWFINGVDTNKPSRGVQGPQGIQGPAGQNASELIGKKSFEDSAVGNWRCADLKTPATLQKGGPVNGFYNWVYPSIGSDLYYGSSRISVKPGDKFYVKALCSNMKSVYNGLNVIVYAHLRYEQGGKTYWAMGPSATITPAHWGWVNGVITVPDNVTQVLPCIATKDMNGKSSASYVAYASFVKLDDYTQSQLNTLSSKITQLTTELDTLQIVKITKIKDV